MAGLFVMNDETQVWEEGLLSVSYTELVIISGHGAARETHALELLGLRLVEFADGKPGKLSLISNNCFQLLLPEPTASPILCKATTRAEYVSLVRELQRAISARADNAIMEALEGIILECETARAESLLQLAMGARRPSEINAR